MTLNALDQVVEVIRGSVDALQTGYDCVVANPWNGDLVWALLGGLAPRLAKGGLLITTAGPTLLEDRDFQQALRRLGLEAQRVYSQDPWALLCARAAT